MPTLEVFLKNHLESLAFTTKIEFKFMAKGGVECKFIEFPDSPTFTVNGDGLLPKETIDQAALNVLYPDGAPKPIGGDIPVERTEQTVFRIRIKGSNPHGKIKRYFRHGQCRPGPCDG